MADRVCAPRGAHRTNSTERVISTVRVRLRCTARDARILDQRLVATGHLRNATLESLLERATAMRADPAWAAARALPPGSGRSDAYRELRRGYGINPGDAVRTAFGHWQRAKWMADVLDSRIAIALAREVLTCVENWLFGHSERPEIKRVGQRSYVEGNDLKAGLRLKHGRVVWPTRLRRKALSMEMDLSDLTVRRRVDLMSRKVLRVGISRETLGGSTRYMAHLTVEGAPYRDPDYLASITPTVGCIDVNVSNIAAQGPSESVLINLYDDGADRHTQVDSRYLRRLQRRADRSRRALNPFAHNVHHGPPKGVRAPVRSRQGREVEGRIREVYRRQAAQQAQWQTRVARTIVSVTGSSIAFESLNFAAWARRRGHYRWGRRLRLTTPAAIQTRVLGEVRLLRGNLTPLASSLALSSYCLCGARAKKSLGQRTHHCESCGFGPVHRDLFAAFLGRQVIVDGRYDLDTAPFGQTRATALMLCQAAGRTVVIPRTVVRPKDKRGGPAKPALQTGPRRPTPTHPFVREVLIDPTARRIPGAALQQCTDDSSVVEVLAAGGREHEASAISRPKSQQADPPCHPAVSELR